MLVASAIYAFWKIPVTTVTHVAHHLGVAVNDTTLAGVLQALLEHVWCGGTIEELMGAFHNRPGPTQLQDYAMLLQCKARDVFFAYG